MHENIPAEKAVGKVRMFSCKTSNSGIDCWKPTTDWINNLVTYQWGEIIAKLIGSADPNYRIAGMYLEFENVAQAGDTVTAPSFDRSRTTEYYNSLSGSGTRDYLRVPLTMFRTGTDVLPGYMIAANEVHYLAKTGGVQGVHGKSFSAAANSVVFGASLVAMVSQTDATRDLIFSSVYLSEDEQQPKLPTSQQIGIEWKLTFN